MAAFHIHHRTCLFFFLFPFLSHVYASCYWPNGECHTLSQSDYTNKHSGTDRNSGGLPANLYDACNPSASASMCCALDSTSDFLNGDSGTICRNDGLCINAKGKKITRTACTDQTWQSPECIKLCVNGTDQANHDVFITPCADGSYCCGENAVATSCCQNGQGYFIVNGEETRVNPNGSSSSSSISSSTSSSTVCILSFQHTSALADASPQPGPQTVTQIISSAPLATSALPIPHSEQSTNVGAIAGAVVGGVLGLAIIVGACWIWIRRRHKPPPPPPKPDSRFSLELGGNYLSEAPTYAGVIKRNELPGGPVSRPELSSS